MLRDPRLSTLDPVYESITVTGLTASRLVSTNASDTLVSVTDLTSWIAGTANRITVADDGDGTITLSAPQDIHTGASPTFVGLTLSGAIATPTNITASGTILSAIGRFTTGVYDNAGTPLLSIDTGNRKLYASNGTSLQMDYSHATGITLSEGGTPQDGSLFFGQGAGVSTTSAVYCNLLGEDCGLSCTNIDYSNFIGYQTGDGAGEADHSNFIGSSAGYTAFYSSYSNFIGANAGSGAGQAKDSIFIGTNAGYSDTVNNTVSGTSIAIGRFSGTGGYSDSISLGHGVVNSAANEINLGNVMKITGIYASDTPSSTLLNGGVNIGTGTFAAGIGTFQSSTDEETLIAQYNSSATNTAYGSLTARHKTSGNMADGFGTRLIFEIEDSSAVNHYAGFIKAVRSNSSDGCGDIIIESSNFDGTVQCARFAYDGNITLFSGVDASNTLTLHGQSDDCVMTYTHATNILDFGDTDLSTSGDLSITDLTVTNDILLASGSIINWNSGDITLTHSADTLTFAGITTFDLGSSAVTTSGSGRFDSGLGIGIAPSASRGIIMSYSSASTGTIAGVAGDITSTYAGVVPITGISGLNFSANYTPSGLLTIAKTISTLQGSYITPTVTSYASETKNITVTNLIGFSLLATLTVGAGASGAVSATNFYQFKAVDVSLVNGATTGTQYAFYDTGMTSGTANWGFYGLSANNYLSGNLYLGQTDGAERIGSDADGYVDIHSSTALRLNGDDDTADPTIQFVSDNSGSITWDEDNNYFAIGALGDLTNVCRIDSTGTITFNGTGRFFAPRVDDAGMNATNGTEGEIVFNEDDNIFYGCTTTGSPATWTAFHA